jgi:hypothetical protein
VLERLNYAQRLLPQEVTLTGADGTDRACVLVYPDAGNMDLGTATLQTGM